MWIWFICKSKDNVNLFHVLCFQNTCQHRNAIYERKMFHLNSGEHFIRDERRKCSCSRCDEFHEPMTPVHEINPLTTYCLDHSCLDIQREIAVKAFCWVHLFYYFYSLEFLFWVREFKRLRGKEHYTHKAEPLRRESE